MKKVLVLCLAMLASGCVVRTSSGRIFFFQRGVMLQVVHTCTDLAVVYQAGRGQVAEVVGATPADVALHPVVPGERYVNATVQSVKDGKVVGTYTHQFYIDFDSTTSVVWTISNTGGYGGGRHDRCQ